jgi:putative spermidine/putrescine transport system ATP-binding protein
VVEYHGREFAVGALTASGANLHVRSDYPPQVGEEVTLTVDPARARLYRAAIEEGLDARERELEEARG